MNNQDNINTLVSKLLTGEINEQEGEALLQEAEKDPSLKENTGSIDKYEPMTPTIHAIENITGLKLSIKNGNVIYIHRE